MDGTHLKALYIGRYQQTKEQGVKRRAQRMASPRPTPPEVFTQNMAREDTKLRSSVQVLTGRIKKDKQSITDSDKQKLKLPLRGEEVTVVH